ncbi:putative programmed cell death 6-interacting protein [Phytophthora cinnamomi]|uniref:putative programmed cell death 6-interacting protein n=1 Tax=Phytophthora cinnamomi TaxID=4785 RepID=UPI0035594B80|nr:putative programmed cell death 6-interacting protein [Phytophthora cinnamomi]
MLGIGFKLSDTSGATLRSSLGDFLRREYTGSEASDAALDQFAQLKEDADLVRTPSAISRHVLLRYYAQLDAMARRFPCDASTSVSAELRSPLQLQFTWNDSFCPRKKSTQAGVAFEKAAVMFNVGALESQLGVQTDRSTADGLKAACRHFMRAAGAFADVKDRLVERTLGARTPDMSAEGLGLLAFLMLAQAQACFYEKAIKDQMKDAIKAKLVHQALDYYVSALEFCRSPALAGSIDRSWGVHLQFQVHCMRAATQYWQGTASKAVALERGEGYGEEITRLVAADAECDEACKVATQNKLPTSLLQSAQALQRVVREHLDAARKDNASVYLENVPKFSELPAVGKASMVKPLGFTEEELQQELGGVDLFEQFVPKDLLHRADSVKQEINTILEQTAEKVSKSNEAAKEKLHAMGLPASIEAFEKTNDNGIPRTIWQRIQHVKVTTASAAVGPGGSRENPVGTFIQQQLQENQRLSDDAEKKLHAIESRLSQEEVEDNVCRQNYGEKKWARPVSTSLNQNFRADIDRYYRLVKEAKTSDSIVRDKLTDNHEQLEALSRPKTSLDQELPALQQDNSSCKEEIAEVSSLLLQLGQLVEEKDQVLRDFRGSYEKFNALPVLLSGNKASGVSTDAALETEKQFFRDHFEGKIATICGEEQTLLSELVDANNRFEAKKETDHVLHERQAFLQHLSDAVDVFEQLESHVKEGAKFYGELGSRIEQLHQTVADHCSARELEKRELELNLTADEEMRQREAEDAALAQKMMNEMQIRNAATGPNASDEALARQLAGSTPQYYQPTQQQSAPPSYNYAQLQPQQQHPYAQYQQAQGTPQAPSFGNASATALPPPYGSVFNQQQQQQQPAYNNYYQYPGQQQHTQYNPLFPRGPSGDSV